MARLAAHVAPLELGDLVGYARALALDASSFPHPSMPRPGELDARVWIAHDGPRGAVVGFCAARGRSRALEVTGLAVDPAHRGRGVGGALLAAAIAEARARRASEVALHVSTGNAPAIALYRRVGFRVARVLRAFYPPARFPDGGDAFEMRLPLAR